MTVVLFLLVEGASSTIRFLGELWSRSREAPLETLHSRYDPLLGWINTPGVRLPDLYGPGKSLTINSQGFRAGRDFARAVPAGRLRVVCAGDSFTLGFGVSDDDAWCQVLSDRDPRLETVNMGEGGYGLDQAYLAYAREGAKIDHDLVLLSFITEDFRRMKRKDFLGYGKPLLRLDGGILKTENVPVPRRGHLAAWWGRNGALFRELKTLELAEAILGRLLPADGSEAPPAQDSDTWKVVLKIFESTEEIARSRHGVLVLVSLPDAADYQVAKSDHWRATLAREASERGIAFVDLVPECRKLPPDVVPTLFNPDFHYSVAGNRWVAETLLRRLLEVPAIAGRLSALPSRASGS